MGGLQRISISMGRAVEHASSWIFGAAKRLFSPSDDDYPKTGVQPFEGDIPDAHHQDS